MKDRSGQEYLAIFLFAMMMMAFLTSAQPLPPPPPMVPAPPRGPPGPLPLQPFRIFHVHVPNTHTLNHFNTFQLPPPPLPLLSPAPIGAIPSLGANPAVGLAASNPVLATASALVPGPGPFGPLSHRAPSHMVTFAHTHQVFDANGRRFFMNEINRRQVDELLTVSSPSPSLSNTNNPMPMVNAQVGSSNVVNQPIVNNSSDNLDNHHNNNNSHHHNIDLDENQEWPAVDGSAPTNAGNFVGDSNGLGLGLLLRNRNNNGGNNNDNHNQPRQLPPIDLSLSDVALSSSSPQPSTPTHHIISSTTQPIAGFPTATTATVVRTMQFGPIPPPGPPGPLGPIGAPSPPIPGIQNQIQNQFGGIPNSGILGLTPQNANLIQNPGLIQSQPGFIAQQPGVGGLGLNQQLPGQFNGPENIIGTIVRGAGQLVNPGPPVASNPTPLQNNNSVVVLPGL